ncbi:MAG TPA: STAS domain-containing protein [Mycobacterium sp.]|nr:STAS domain-containing protein [Mycobacterium sp.]
MTTHWGRCGVVIAVHGEIDAANAAAVNSYVQRCAGNCAWLVLDLSDLEFIGTAGFSALRALGSRYATANICWSMVPGSAVSRLLRICDPDSLLPTAESVGVALARVQNPSRSPLLARQTG